MSPYELIGMLFGFVLFTIMLRVVGTIFEKKKIIRPYDGSGKMTAEDYGYSRDNITFEKIDEPPPKPKRRAF